MINSVHHTSIGRDSVHTSCRDSERGRDPCRALSGILSGNGNFSSGRMSILDASVEGISPGANHILHKGGFHMLEKLKSIDLTVLTDIV